MLGAGCYSDYQNDVPLIESLNEVRSRGVFFTHKIIRTAVLAGIQPQAFWRGTRQGAIRRSGQLLRATEHWCYRGADPPSRLWAPAWDTSKPPDGMRDLVEQKNIL